MKKRPPTPRHQHIPPTAEEQKSYERYRKWRETHWEPVFISVTIQDVFNDNVSLGKMTTTEIRKAIRFISKHIPTLPYGADRVKRWINSAKVELHKRAQ